MALSNEEFINNITQIGYKQIEEDDYILEILGNDDSDLKLTVEQLNHHIRNIASNEFKKVAQPITMQVIGVNSDGSINVNKPSDVNGNSNLIKEGFFE